MVRAVEPEPLLCAICTIGSAVSASRRRLDWRLFGFKLVGERLARDNHFLNESIIALPPDRDAGSETRVLILPSALRREPHEDRRCDSSFENLPARNKLCLKGDPAESSIAWIRFNNYILPMLFMALSMCILQSSIFLAFMESWAIIISFDAISFFSFIIGSFMPSTCACIFIIDALSHFDIIIVSAARTGIADTDARTMAARVHFNMVFSSTGA
jgi:hypothetical protein